MASTVAFMLLATNLESPKPQGSICGKALSAVQVWRDPKIWLLQCTNLTFGFAAARVGKGPVVALGAASFILLGVLSRWVGNPATWGAGVLIFYALHGVGRAVYESTNKAIFADFFPGEKSTGAFANVFIFSTGSSTVAFILGATEEASAELYLLLVF